MAWDPTQGQGQGQPGSAGPDPHSGYGTPQNPYGAPPPQNPYGAPPPQSPYGAPQNPYGAPPPQNPYGAPQNPYGAPPQQQYTYQQGGYGYAPPQQPARPLAVSIRDLPNQYRNVLTHPSDVTFAAEVPKADWQTVWVQLGILVVVGVILGLISSAIAGAVVHATTGSTSYAAAFSAFSVATTISGAFLNIVFIPLFFFAGVGIQYLLAKAFNGQGTFLQQSYTHLLFKVPLDIASVILGTILVFVPIVGGIIGFAIFVYQVVLNVFQIKAVHRLDTGRAAAVVLIPYGVLLLVGILCALAFASFFLALLNAGGR